MRIFYIHIIFIFSLYADVELDNINTSLYSKSGVNVLKDVSISLDFEGVDLNKNKLLDATNSVISAFFYEDLFTELGKNAFKKTLIKILAKKYAQKVDAIYILKLSNHYKYDTKSLKEFLKKQLDSKDDDIIIPTVKSPKISPPTKPKLSLPSSPTIISPKLSPPTKQEAKKEDTKKSFKAGNIPSADDFKKDLAAMEKLMQARKKMQEAKKAEQAKPAKKIELKIPKREAKKIEKKDQGPINQPSKRPLPMPFNKGRNLNQTPVERGSLPAIQELLLKDQAQKLRELTQPGSKQGPNIQKNLEKIRSNMGVDLLF